MVIAPFSVDFFDGTVTKVGRSTDGFKNLIHQKGENRCATVTFRYRAPGRSVTVTKERVAAPGRPARPLTENTSTSSNCWLEAN